MSGTSDLAAGVPSRADQGITRRRVKPLWLLALLAVALKLKMVVLLAAKLKLAAPSASMVVAIGSYSIFFGWRFATGFVALIFAHELGHVAEARRQGLRTSAPLFIPFLGALITIRDQIKDARHEAQLALAGPIVGSLAALGCLVAAALSDSDLLRALAYTGFFINLFNLLPISPLDGGRIAAAIHPAIWLIGFLGAVMLFVFTGNIFFALIAIVGGVSSFRRLRRRGDNRYYALSTRTRLVVACAYMLLAAGLAVAVSVTYIELPA